MNEELQLQDENEMLKVCGPLDKNLQELEENFSVAVIPRGNSLLIQGEPEDVKPAKSLLNDYLTALRSQGGVVSVRDFITAWQRDTQKSQDMVSDTILVSRRGTPIQPRTVVQEDFVQEIRENPVVFGIGPAGTGKTYLSMAMALSFFQSERVSRIILVRPAVEAGENLGFLPGDLQEKVNPYLRPLYDAIYDMMDIKACDELIDEGVLEVVPLAFMRGRTLSDSFVILDEAQNTTIPQMKMFLTRLGPNSHTVVNGDVTQVDLPEKIESGLIHARRVLRDVSNISFVKFTGKDVVRHEIVKKIIDAYEKKS
jgi:phosphate starvation-inducible PhoH-like protein